MGFIADEAFDHGACRALDEDFDRAIRELEHLHDLGDDADAI